MGRKNIFNTRKPAKAYLLNLINYLNDNDLAFINNKI